MTTDSLPNIWVVRADGGQYTEACVKGGFTGIGWNEVGDLFDFSEREALKRRFEESFPEHSGQARGNVERFRFDVVQGDYVITPASNSNLLHYGSVVDDRIQYVPNPTDGCRYAHRRRVKWAAQPLNRQQLSVPLQRGLGRLTVSRVRQRQEFLSRIGVLDEPSKVSHTEYDPYESVLNKILQLTPGEFEELVRYLLAALGFEETETVGGSGDRGLDVKGTLIIPGLISVALFVQVKRYQLTARVSDRDVIKLRQVIPAGGQGAVITTADFAKKAYDAATEPGFPRVGLINGHQLVDMLVEHWDDIFEEFRDKLGLILGLVPA